MGVSRDHIKYSKQIIADADNFRKMYLSKIPLQAIATHYKIAPGYFRSYVLKEVINSGIISKEDVAIRKKNAYILQRATTQVHTMERDEECINEIMNMGADKVAFLLFTKPESQLATIMCGGNKEKFGRIKYKLYKRLKLSKLCVFEQIAADALGITEFDEWIKVFGEFPLPDGKRERVAQMVDSLQEFDREVIFALYVRDAKAVDLAKDYGCSRSNITRIKRHCLNMIKTKCQHMFENDNTEPTAEEAKIAQHTMANWDLSKIGICVGTCNKLSYVDCYTAADLAYLCISGHIRRVPCLGTKKIGDILMRLSKIGIFDEDLISEKEYKKKQDAIGRGYTRAEYFIFIRKRIKLFRERNHIY